MTNVVEHHDAGPVRQGLPPPPGGLRRLLYPGFLRAAWMVPLFFGIGSGIVVLDDGAHDVPFFSAHFSNAVGSITTTRERMSA
jgi:hypothetical protein